MATITNKSKRDFQFPVGSAFIVTRGNGEITTVPEETAFEIQNKFSHLSEIKNGQIEISIDKKYLKNLKTSDESQEEENIDKFEKEKPVVTADHSVVDKQSYEQGKQLVKDQDIVISKKK